MPLSPIWACVYCVCLCHSLGRGGGEGEGRWPVPWPDCQERAVSNLQLADTPASRKDGQMGLRTKGSDRILTARLLLSVGCCPFLLYVSETQCPSSPSIILHIYNYINHTAPCLSSKLSMLALALVLSSEADLPPMRACVALALMKADLPPMSSVLISASAYWNCNFS
jgi:hypothetical protein